MAGLALAELAPDVPAGGVINDSYLREIDEVLALEAALALPAAEASRPLAAASEAIAIAEVVQTPESADVGRSPLQWVHGLHYDKVVVGGQRRKAHLYEVRDELRIDPSARNRARYVGALFACTGAVVLTSIIASRAAPGAGDVLGISNVSTLEPIGGVPEAPPMELVADNSDDHTTWAEMAWSVAVTVGSEAINAIHHVNHDPNEEQHVILPAWNEQTGDGSIWNDLLNWAHTHGYPELTEDQLAQVKNESLAYAKLSEDDATHIHGYTRMADNDLYRVLDKTGATYNPDAVAEGNNLHPGDQPDVTPPPPPPATGSEDQPTTPNDTPPPAVAESDHPEGWWDRSVGPVICTAATLVGGALAFLGLRRMSRGGRTSMPHMPAHRAAADPVAPPVYTNVQLNRGGQDGERGRGSTGGVGATHAIMAEAAGVGSEGNGDTDQDHGNEGDDGNGNDGTDHTSGSAIVPGGLALTPAEGGAPIVDRDDAAGSTGEYDGADGDLDPAVQRLPADDSTTSMGGTGGTAEPTDQPPAGAQGWPSVAPLPGEADNGVIIESSPTDSADEKFDTLGQPAGTGSNRTGSATTPGPGDWGVSHG